MKNRSTPVAIHTHPPIHTTKEGPIAGQLAQQLLDALVHEPGVDVEDATPGAMPSTFGGVGLPAEVWAARHDSILKPAAPMSTMRSAPYCSRSSWSKAPVLRRLMANRPPHRLWPTVFTKSCPHRRAPSVVADGMRESPHRSTPTARGKLLFIASVLSFAGYTPHVHASPTP